LREKTNTLRGNVFSKINNLDENMAEIPQVFALPVCGGAESDARPPAGAFSRRRRPPSSIEAGELAGARSIR